MAKDTLNEFQIAAAIALYGAGARGKASTTRKLAADMAKRHDAGIGPALILLLAGRDIGDPATRLLDAEREVQTEGCAGSRPEIAQAVARFIEGTTPAEAKRRLETAEAQVRSAMAACGAVLMARMPAPMADRTSEQDDEEPLPVCR